MTRAARTGIWAIAALLVILVGRTIAYALNPSPLAQMLEHRAGGPALPVVSLVALTLAAGSEVAICWLAAVAVRERALVERRALSAPLPRLGPARIVAAALLLWVLTSIAGGLLEAYIHWRAGLGWHGLSCLIGPVHRDLLPIFGALSLVAAAIVAAAEHLVAWVRRTFALLRTSQLGFGRWVAIAAPVDRGLPRARMSWAPAAARAPPYRS
jgi:hypothetical protein